MREEKDWGKVRLMYLQAFCPRIQKVLSNIPDLTDLPDPIESYYIYGEVGFGKSILAAQMMLEEQKRIWLAGGPKNESEKCLYVSVPELLQEIKESYNPGSKTTEKQIIAKYNAVHLLVLDDFGLSKPTDFVLQTLYLIINHRYDYLRKSIFTSNLSLEEVAEVFADDRITSRINRMCALIEKQNWEK